MSTTRYENRSLQADHDGASSLLFAAGVALTGVLGYGIALGLARVTEYAEKVEEDEYCRGADGPARP